MTMIKQIITTFQIVLLPFSLGFGEPNIEMQKLFCTFLFYITYQIGHKVISIKFLNISRV